MNDLPSTTSSGLTPLSSASQRGCDNPSVRSKTSRLEQSLDTAHSDIELGRNFPLSGETAGGPERSILAPFLKWAGGKRWLAAHHAYIFPSTFDRYVEPFLGSAAVYFYLRPRYALLSDANPNLINAYAEIRRDWKKVATALRRHHKNHCSDHYYAERARVRRAPHERAAQFLYLNRTCWNGLYRVNKRGQFNVPIGTKQSVLLPTDDWQAVSITLQGAELSTVDFEVTLDRSGVGDFVFVDPPYVTRHNLNGFLKYNDKIFSWSDQERLRHSVDRAAHRGAKILITNADHESIRELYGDAGQLVALPRQSVLAGSPAHRGATTELAILINYTAEGCLGRETYSPSADVEGQAMAEGLG